MHCEGEAVFLGTANSVSRKLANHTPKAIGIITVVWMVGGAIRRADMDSGMRPATSTQYLAIAFMIAGCPLPYIPSHIHTPIRAITLRRIFAYWRCPFFVHVEIA